LLRQGHIEIPLPPRVLGVLELLLARAGEVVARQELIDSVWKEAFVTDTSLAEAVSVLRQALGDDPQAPRYIQTVHRRGYRFVAPVTETGPAALGSSMAAAPVQSAAAEVASPSIGGSLVPWTVAAICATLAAAAVWQFTTRQSVTAPVVRLRVDPVAGTAFDLRAPALVLSPDGSRAAWSACDSSGCRLYTRPLDAIDPSIIPGTDGASAPFFSPDGRWVGFFADGKLRKVAIAGGEPVSIADAPQPLGAAWLPSGRIVFAASARGGLKVVSERGGDAVALTTPNARAGEFGHAWPSALPDGRSMLFTIVRAPLVETPGRIAVLTLDGNAARWQPVIDAADMARPMTADYIAYSRGGELHGVPFDRVRNVTAGAEQVVVTGMAPAQFATSDRGGLIYAANAPGIMPRTLGWWNETGASGISRDVAGWRALALSPDGSRLAGVGEDQPGADIRLADLGRGSTTRLTHGGLNVSPVWARDGRTLFYGSSRGGAFGIWRRDAAGATPEVSVPVSSDDRHRVPAGVSRDGVLIYVESGGPTQGDIWMSSMEGAPPVPLVHGVFDETGAALSPDGALLAFQSDESGRWEVSLMRLGDRQRMALSTGGGMAPFWSDDGRSVYYRASDRLMRVDVSAAGNSASAPVEAGSLSGAEPIGVAPGGRMLLRRGGRAIAPYAVITLEWVRELRQTLGPPAATMPR
jgi:serine/threonine-protein kinase